MARHRIRALRDSYILNPGRGPAFGSPPAGGGGSYLTLPYTYNLSSRSESSGAQLDSVPGWVDGGDAWGAGSGLALGTSNLADSNSFTPTGVTKVATASGGQNFSFDFTLPNSKTIDPTLDGLRIACLARRYSPGIDYRAVRFNLYDQTKASYDLNGDLREAYIGQDIITDTTPDQLRQYVRYNDGSVKTWSPGYTQTGTNTKNRWWWTRHEINFRTNKGTVSNILCQTDATMNTLQETFETDLQNYGHVPPGMFLCYFYAFSTHYPFFAGFWIGTLDDAWPTTTLGSTTEDYG